MEILFSIVESDGIDKYLWVEASTTPYLAVPKIEENQKGNNFRLRFSITDVEFPEVNKSNNPSCWDLWCAGFNLNLTLVRLSTDHV